ncbi:MAG TPA: hypothetical protein DCZ04_15240 [Syntrophorhabdus aromaticivorans]|nr:hypothetical protein [Syntrophorhabdus aromaticivorans]
MTKYRRRDGHHKNSYLLRPERLFLHEKLWNATSAKEVKNGEKVIVAKLVRSLLAVKKKGGSK